MQNALAAHRHTGPLLNFQIVAHPFSKMYEYADTHIGGGFRLGGGGI